MPSPRLTMIDPAVRAAGIRRVLLVTLVLNLAVSAGKVVVGLLASSLTVVADGFHSLLDGLNNVVGLIAISVAARPADAEHPYGHRKFENIAALAIGALILLLSWELTRHIGIALWQGLHGTAPPPAEGDTSPVFLAVVVCSLLVNMGVAWYERREGDRLRSPLLKADAGHTISDSAVTMLGIVSLLAGRQAWWLDPLLAVGVVVFLLRVAWTIVGEHLRMVTDEARLDPELVRAVAETVPGVRDTHAIRSHGSENDMHLDLHIVVAASLSAQEVENIEGRVRQALHGEFPSITQIGIHHQTEPPESGQPVWRDA